MNDDAFWITFNPLRKVYFKLYILQVKMETMKDLSLVQKYVKVAAVVSLYWYVKVICLSNTTFIC